VHGDLGGQPVAQGAEATQAIHVRRAPVHGVDGQVERVAQQERQLAVRGADVDDRGGAGERRKVAVGIFEQPVQVQKVRQGVVSVPGKVIARGPARRAQAFGEGLGRDDELADVDGSLGGRSRSSGGLTVAWTVGAAVASGSGQG
jgi:hypothetical protein